MKGSRYKLLALGCLQWIIVSLNTGLIANGQIIGTAIVTGTSAVVWATIVKGIAFGDKWDKVAFAAGCTVGSVIGTSASILIGTVA